MASRGIIPSAIYELAAELRTRCDEEYQSYQEGYAADATHATHGQTVRKESRKRGVTTWDLITHNRIYAHAHATEEMRDYMAAHPHLSARAFERQWVEAQRDVWEMVR